MLAYFPREQTDVEKGGREMACYAVPDPFGAIVPFEVEVIAVISNGRGSGVA
jgi:hypothetical protein